MKKTFYKACLLVSIIALMIVSALLAYQYTLRKDAETALDKLQGDTHSGIVESAESTDDMAAAVSATIAESIVSTVQSVPTDSTGIPAGAESHDVLAERGITIPEKNIDWDALHSVNPDIYAWIYVPGTNIDYPIVQHPDEKSYYLKHNLDGSEGYPGCIYTQNVNTKDWTDPNTVIYGHNMNDGSMFHDLHRFEDAAFFNETQYLFIYTPEKNLAYEIFASYPFSDLDLIMCFDYSTPEALLVYFDGIWTNRSMTSHFRDSTVLYGDSRIVTLSTCIGGQPDMRYLVQAVLLGP